jgi:hypothetical protein
MPMTGQAIWRMTCGAILTMMGNVGNREENKL